MDTFTGKASFQLDMITHCSHLVSPEEITCLVLQLYHCLVLQFYQIAKLAGDYLF